MKVPLERLERRDVLTIIKDSLEDRFIIQRNETRTFEQEGARYKMIIDDSEDESAMKLLFSNKVLDEKAVVHLCSDFAEESNLHVRIILHFLNVFKFLHVFLGRYNCWN